MLFAQATQHAEVEFVGRGSQSAAEVCECVFLSKQEKNKNL